jgi:hypothetical protein
MLLGFKTRFAAFVQEGSKRHTVRALLKRERKAGEVCHCYTGLRTKNCRLLGRWRCVKVEPLTITVSGLHMSIAIAGEILSDGEASAFAWRDGFRPPGSSQSQPGQSLELMRDFWTREHGPAARHFFGEIIHWNFDERVEQ